VNTHLYTKKDGQERGEQATPPLSNLMGEDWRVACNLIPAQVYPAAVELFPQGSPAREVYLIEFGLIKLFRLGQDGQELIVGLRSAGWILGAASVIIRKSHPVTAVTLTNCRIRRIPAHTFLTLLNSDAELSWHLHQEHCQEIYNQFSQLVGLGCMSARHRLEHLLWQLTSALEPDESQKEIRLELPLKYWEIAELIAITPQYLSRVLKQLQEEGIINREKGGIVVSSPHKLWHAVDF
jgi:CRP-like cAMP-binding protein